ncbi:NmrA family NAD(P)-binding protein [Streptomyces canus]|uniref:NmrA family NAD(P)-binding protein n=1 Tax=Streptomyces canus TaxID=58343 RepID=UPI00324A38B9
MSETEAVRSEEPPLLAVIGAAGLCGTYLLEAAQRSPFRIRAVVHGPGGRERVAALGVDETVEADLAEPDAVRQAVKNADLVFIGSVLRGYPSLQAGEETNLLRSRAGGAPPADTRRSHRG